MNNEEKIEMLENALSIIQKVDDELYDSMLGYCEDYINITITDIKWGKYD